MKQVGSPHLFNSSDPGGRAPAGGKASDTLGRSHARVNVNLLLRAIQVD